MLVAGEVPEEDLAKGPTKTWAPDVGVGAEAELVQSSPSAVKAERGRERWPCPRDEARGDEMQRSEGEVCELGRGNQSGWGG